jgi:hypothetical protein
MKLDIKNFNHQLIVAAMTNMVDEGASPREVIGLLEDIKKPNLPFRISGNQPGEKKCANSSIDIETYSTWTSLNAVFTNTLTHLILKYCCLLMLGMMSRYRLLILPKGKSFR